MRQPECPLVFAVTLHTLYDMSVTSGVMLSRFPAVVDLSAAVVLTRSDIRSPIHHRSTQPCVL
jgi:hypothetical protein